MDRDLIVAHLNLYAVLQNLEDLVKLDEEMAALTKDWKIVIQFLVRKGPEAYVEFDNGQCRHGAGRHPSPTEPRIKSRANRRVWASTDSAWWAARSN